MIMDKESIEAWARYTRAVIEINMCMREQRFLHSKMTYEDIDKAFKDQDKMVVDYLSKENKIIGDEE